MAIVTGEQALASDVMSMLQADIAANIPAAATVPDGSIYYETDTYLLKQEQANAWVVVNKIIATGSYVGDATAGFQVSVGFKCSMVIISQLHTNYILIPNSGIQHVLAGGHTDRTANLYLHAADGFQTGTGVTAANLNGATHYYWAISE